MTHIARFSLSVLLLAVSTDVRSQVTLSEVMFDALGSESHDEFVEIVNLSETDSVDLTGWRISDGQGVDEIIAFEQGLILGPQQFAIILDASYFENSSLYDDLIPDAALILTIDNLTFGSRGFSNSTAETVTLLDAVGEVVSDYTYSLNNDMGFSDEKINLFGPNSAENWANSRGLLGTPGAPNSVSPLQHDLAISAKSLTFVPDVAAAGEDVTITATIKNEGVQTVDRFDLLMFVDLDADSLPDLGEELAQPFSFVGDLRPNDSTAFTLLYENVASGKHLIGAQIVFERDENLANNVAIKELLVGFASRTIVINEIMYSPLPDQAEWIELLNMSAGPIDLGSWTISDVSENESMLETEGVLIQPDDFYVFAEDSSVLQLFSPLRFSILKNWPTLNNDFDSVVLRDFTGSTIDRVDYNRDWGGDQGISLERISPELTSNDSSNWSSSVVVEGGTPGEQNSIFARVLPAQTALAIEPNPFSPDGDGKDDFAVISFEIPVSTAVINMKIYDMRGRLIRFLANNQPTGSQNAIIWDGRDDRDRMVRMGIYLVFLQALNAQAGVLQTAKKTIVLAGEL